tara:strand:- start:783 stop:917 length:135 start_codon:yes stop_codon:yes gene_type:complete
MFYLNLGLENHIALVNREQVELLRSFGTLLGIKYDGIVLQLMGI